MYLMTPKRIKRNYKKRVSIDETTFAVMEAAVTHTGHTLASFATMAIEKELVRSGYAFRYDDSTQQMVWYEANVQAIVTLDD